MGGKERSKIELNQVLLCDNIDTNYGFRRVGKAVNLHHANAINCDEYGRDADCRAG